MKTTKEKIAVMLAYIDGKQIQFRRAESEEKWEDLSFTRDPTWNWKNNDYRVKPEPKEPTYRPYINFAEFRAEWEKHGGWMIDKRGGEYTLCTICDKETSKYCLQSKVWADDESPCGIKVEE